MLTERRMRKSPIQLDLPRRFMRLSGFALSLSAVSGCRGDLEPCAGVGVGANIEIEIEILMSRSLLREPRCSRAPVMNPAASPYQRDSTAHTRDRDIVAEEISEHLTLRRQLASGSR
jgi:hypothetical protein